MFAINMVLCICCAIWLYWQRNSNQVKVSQPFFLYLVLFGCVISTSTIVIMVQEHEGTGPVVACAFIPWFYSIGFSITFGTLFAKILRVYRLFKSAAQLQRIKITVKSTVLNICAITSVDVIICLVWTIFDPMHWTRQVLSVDKFGIPLESQGYCTSNSWRAFTYTIVGWHFLLLGMAMYLCYASRNISARFAEAKPLAVVMISQFQIFLISIPVLIIVGGQVASSFFVRSAVIWLNDFSVVLIVFGNLMYAVHFNNIENLEVGSAVKDFTVRQKRDSMKVVTMGGGRRRDSDMSRFSSSVNSGDATNRVGNRTSSTEMSGISRFSSSERMVMGLKSFKGKDNDSRPIGSTIDSDKIMTYASSELFFDDKIMEEIVDKEEDNNEAVDSNNNNW